jgi:hypothetical protein
MRWSVGRKVVTWIVILFPLLLGVAWGVFFAIFPGRGYDVWTWLAIGFFNGFVYGFLSAIAIYLGFTIVDWWRKPHERQD